MLFISSVDLKNKLAMRLDVVELLSKRLKNQHGAITSQVNSIEDIIAFMDEHSLHLACSDRSLPTMDTIYRPCHNFRILSDGEFISSFGGESGHYWI